MAKPNIVARIGFPFGRDPSLRAGLVASLLLTAAAAPVTLPPPSGDPAAIDFAADPLIRFARGTAPAEPFLARLGEAVGHHPAVAAAVAEAQAVDGVRTQVRSGLFPQLDASLVGSRQLARDFGSRDTIVESLQPHGRTDAVLNGQQLLFDWGATGNRIAAANQRILAARAEVDRVASLTALSAVAAWYDVLAAQALLGLSRAAEARQQTILDQVRERVRQGLGAGGDSARAAAMLAEAQGATARFERRLGEAGARYREAYGDAPPELAARPLAPSSQAPSLDAAAALARRSPEVIAATKRAEAARRDWRAAKADGLPQLTAGVAATRYAVFERSDYEVRGLLTLRQNLTAGGRQRGLIAEALGKSRAAAADAERTAGESERDAAAAFADVAALTRSLAALEAGYTANRRVRDGYAEQFRVSRGTLIELLRAEQDYQAAAAALLQGVVDLDLARFALLARTGELLPAAGIRLDTSLSGAS